MIVTIDRLGMTEAELQAGLIEAAKLHGWECFHDYDSRRSAPGFPDLVLAKSGRVLFLELKAQRGRVSADQRRWLAALDGTPGIVAAVVRPEPKEDGEMSYDDALEELAR